MQEQGKLDQSHFRRPSSPPTRSLLFYKLIFSSTLEAKRLRIPQKFVNRSGDQLSAVTSLTLPNGGVWHVGLKKADKKFWFFHGWHEFVEYYSIQVGYFLIFRYEGNSNFYVNIYDLTAAEINYPSCEKEMNDDDDDDHHDSAKTSGSAPRVSFRKTMSDESVEQQPPGIDYSETLRLAEDGDDLRATFHSTRDVGIEFNNHEGTDPECDVGWLSLDTANGKAYRTKAKRKRNEPDANESSAQHKDELKLPGLKTSVYTSKQRWRAVTAEEKKRAIHAAKMFQPSYPFCRVILRPSYIRDRLPLHMPSGFAKKYLRGVSKYITLQVSDGKQWSVWCNSYGEGRVKLSTGWAAFVGDNNLEEGDVCIFELINMDDVVLKVTIFHVLEDARVENQSSA